LSRLGIADPSSEDFLCLETFWNNISYTKLASDTKRALNVALLDAAGNQITPEAIATSLGDGRQTVSTAGSAVALAGATTIKEVTITAEEDNTGTIVVGGSTVVAALGTRRGAPIEAGDSITLKVDDLAEVYIDTTVNGDGVTYLYTA